MASPLRDRVHSEICSRGFNPQVRAFAQSYGSDVLDASVLVIPCYGFLPADDPRVRSTVTAVEKDLLRNGFVLAMTPGTVPIACRAPRELFVACTFWLPDNYAFSGRIKEAENLFKRLVSLRNHLGLLSEEYDWKLQRQIRNFPQAFSHLVIQTTFNIENMYVKGQRAA